jgi:hypothetical protein
LLHDRPDAEAILVALAGGGDWVCGVVGGGLFVGDVVMARIAILVLILIAGCGRSPVVAPVASVTPTTTSPQLVIARQTRDVRKSVEGQLFLTSMLLDLDSFRGTDEFLAKGFGAGGKHHRWMDEMQSVSSRADYSQFTQDERIASGDLMGLGLRYVLNQNQEDEYTRFARAEVHRVLGK